MATKTQQPRCSKANEAKILKEYMSNGYNMTQAVLAVFPHYKKTSARQLAYVLLKKNRDAVNKIKDEENEAYKEEVMSLQERRAWLSNVIKDTKNEEITMSDRINAMKLLNKIDGVGTSANITHVTNNIQNLSLEDRKQVVATTMKQLIDKEHVIDVEYDEVDE